MERPRRRCANIRAGSARKCPVSALSPYRPGPGGATPKLRLFTELTPEKNNYRASAKQEGAVAPTFVSNDALGAAHDDGGDKGAACRAGAIALAGPRPMPCWLPHAARERTCPMRARVRPCIGNTRGYRTSRRIQTARRPRCASPALCRRQPGHAASRARP